MSTSIHSATPRFGSHSAIPYLTGSALVAVVCLLSAQDWRAGLTLAVVSVFIVTVSVKLEWGPYCIIIFVVVLIDGWNANRSPDQVPFRLSMGHIYIMEFAVYGLLAAYLLRRALDGSSALSGWFVQT